MAVTTLAQIPLGYLPLEVGPGPFPEYGSTNWWLIRQKLLALMDNCVDKGEGGIGWYRKLEWSFLDPRHALRY